MARASLQYRSRRDPLEALRMRLRELAASRVRFGYRRLTVLLRREGWQVNAKRIFRLYTDEGRRCGTNTAPRPRAKIPLAYFSGFGSKGLTLNRTLRYILENLALLFFSSHTDEMPVRSLT